MIFPFNKLKQMIVNYYTIKEIRKMDTNIKTEGMKFLTSQTPRVLIFILTVGTLVGLKWFGKSDLELTIAISVVGCIAQWMNYKILAMAKKDGKL